MSDGTCSIEITGNSPLVQRFLFGEPYSLAYEDEGERMLTDSEIDQDARKFLLRVVETNNIGFPDDLRYRRWSAG
jgi:hypothetical protein